MSEGIQVSIMSPDEVVWEGLADSLSSENREGVFDILPGHANFISIIKDTNVTLVIKDEGEKVFSFDQAVLLFGDDSAKIYIHTSSVNEEQKGDKV